MAALTPYGGRAQVVGLTGPPGVGKPTLTSALVTALRAAGRWVGVLAVDPTSPFSGGALLGDRVRMGEHALDSGVFIRSMAARGHLGGLAWSMPQAVRVLDAAGYDVILIETVGVGQSEIEIAELADTTVVLLAPGMGDGIQAAKAGILEIADIYVVNKSDREGADRVLREIGSMISLTESTGWQPPVLATIAAEDVGTSPLVEAMTAHYSWLTASGELATRRSLRARAEVEAIAVAALRERWGGVGGAELDDLGDRVAQGELDPYAAADRLVATGPDSL